MNTFAYSSYKHQTDQELLDRLGKAIFALKLQAQNRLFEYGLDTRDVDEEYEDLATFLADLVKRTRLLVMEPIDGQVNMTFTGLSQRFIDVNRADVPDRIAEIVRLQLRLDQGEQMKDRDFQLLDGLHDLLEEESAEGVRGLYAF